MILFYGLFMLLALAGAFLWRARLAFCILLFLAATAGLGLRLLWKGKGARLLPLLPLPMCLVLCLAAGQAASPGSMREYDVLIKKAVSYIEKGDLDKGTEVLDQLDETFGVTDLSLYARAEQYIALKDYGTALDCVCRAEDVSSRTYYEYMERIYILQDTEESEKRLGELYLAAVKDIPDSSYMQFMAGLTRLAEGSYQGSIYYFLRARELDETDPLPCYYLGVVYFEQNDPKQAVQYFADAIERGIDSEKEAYIKWYISEILKGVPEE